MHKDLGELLDDRETERDILIEEIETTLREKQMDLGSVAAGMIIILTRLLVIRSDERDSTQFPSHHDQRLFPIESNLFVEEVAPLVSRFSQVKEERDLIFAKLLRGMCKSFTEEFYAQFLTKTQNERRQFLEKVGKLDTKDITPPPS